MGKRSLCFFLLFTGFSVSFNLNGNLYVDFSVHILKGRDYTDKAKRILHKYNTENRKYR